MPKYGDSLGGWLVEAANMYTLHCYTMACTRVFQGNSSSCRSQGGSHGQTKVRRDQSANCDRLGYGPVNSTAERRLLAHEFFAQQLRELIDDAEHRPKLVRGRAREKSLDSVLDGATGRAVQGPAARGETE